MDPRVWTGSTVAGADESHYGCLLGPICEAAVVLPDNRRAFITKLKAMGLAIRDSKKTTPEQRHRVFNFITTHVEAYSIVLVSSQYIEDLGNVREANIKGVEAALNIIMDGPSGYQEDTSLIQVASHRGKVNLTHAYMDGDAWGGWARVPVDTVVKGDAEYWAIAAASILAKTVGDLYVKKLSIAHPVLLEYDVEKRHGYWTKKHKDVLDSKGTTWWHRNTTYAPMKHGGVAGTVRKDIGPKPEFIL